MLKYGVVWTTLCLLGALVLPASAFAGDGGPPPGLPVHVCPGPANPGSARCHSLVVPQASNSPTGLSPATIKSAYNFPTSLTAGSGVTIGIVDA
jgi:hypothetical protein